jgi:hypothetical protein
LCQPLYLACVLLLVFNDHLLKRHWPGGVSGKLSDFAGLCFFPVLVVSLLELARLLPPSPRARAFGLGGFGALSALAFALVETWAPATTAFRWAWGGLRWLPSALVQGHALPLRLAGQTPDAGDLWALPCAFAGFLWHERACQRAPRAALGDGAQPARPGLTRSRGERSMLPREAAR